MFLVIIFNIRIIYNEAAAYLSLKAEWFESFYHIGKPATIMFTKIGQGKEVTVEDGILLLMF